MALGKFFQSSRQTKNNHTDVDTSAGVFWRLMGQSTNIKNANYDYLAVITN